MHYPVQVTKVENGYRVFCRDIPECDFTESTLEELQITTENLLPGCIEHFYRKAGKKIPLPSKPLKDETMVYVPVRVQAKLLLWNAIVEKGIRLKQLADELGISKSQMQRMVDFSKPASIDSVENAMQHLGLSFDLQTKLDD